jgi:hypothetical protein
VAPARPLKRSLFGRSPRIYYNFIRTHYFEAVEGFGVHILSRILDKCTARAGGGELSYFGLSTWWSSTFSRTEQEYMEAAFLPPDLPARSRPLTRDRGLLTFETATGLLTVLAERLSEKPQDRALAGRVLAKAEERALAEGDILGLHFTYHQMIRLHYRWRDHFADALNLAFAACHKQMRLAPQALESFRKKCPHEALPIHLGYQQAATILEQQGAYTQAIEICRKAESEGWSGNWSWRRQRMARKLGYSVKPISTSGLGPV